MFTRLSTDGQQHAKNIEHIKEILTREGEGSQPIVFPFRTAIPKPEEWQGYTADVEQTYYAMKTHIDFEREMARTSTEVSSKIRNEEAKTLLQKLFKDEGEHHKLLFALIRDFEKRYEQLLGSFTK